MPKLAWENAEWLVTYELDHYFDLSWDADKAWRPRIAALVTRFQGQAGPELVLFLQKSRETLIDGLTEEKVASLFHEWDELRVRHLSPLMSPEQRNHFVGQLDGWKNDLTDSLRK